MNTTIWTQDDPAEEGHYWFWRIPYKKPIVVYMKKNVDNEWWARYATFSIRFQPTDQIHYRSITPLIEPPIPN
jgi:hypothetical protein